VDIDGDLAVIASPSDDHAATDAGSVYVFRRDGANWVEEQKLIASDAGADDRFGRDAAISGGRILVGAFDASYGALTQAGAAYTFIRSGGVWVEEQRLVPSDPQFLGHFGWAVAMDYGVMVISAIHEEFGGGDESGAAYVFRHNGTAWVEEQKLVGSDTATFDYFGTSVAVDGNVIVVGARLADPDGAAYVFRHNGSTWVEEQKLSPTGGRRRFGVSADVQDEWVVVGADDNGTPAFGAGGVFVFQRSGGLWNLHQFLTGSDIVAGDAFGDSIGLRSPFLLIGAPAHQTDGIIAGAAYLFRGPAPWAEVAKFIPSDLQDFTNLGGTLAITETSVLVGALGDGDADPKDPFCASGAGYFVDLVACFNSIPALSAWGMVLMAIVLVTFGGILASRRGAARDVELRTGNERSQDMKSMLRILVAGSVVCFFGADALAEQPLRPRTPPSQGGDDR
jgi:hypothetical protein